MNKHFYEVAPTEVREALPVLDNTVSRTLIFLGIYPCRKGHLLLKDGILYYLIQYAKGATTDLYRCVAMWHNCTPRAAESNIRSAIRAAYDTGALYKINDLLGITIVDKCYSLSNMEFISLVAQYCYYSDVSIIVRTKLPLA